MSEKNRPARWPACAALLLALCAPALAKVQVNVEDWGLGGAVKSGLWSQLYVELKSAGADFAGSLEVLADSGQAVLPVFVKPIQLVADTPAHHWIYFRAAAATYRRSPCTFTWQLRDERGRVVWTSQWRQSDLLPAADSVVAVFRTADIVSAGLGALFDPNSEVRAHTRLVSLPMAPDRALGYESADALVWVNPDAARLADPAQADAIVNYVRQGGHLVVAAGAGWQALSQSFLAKLLPAQPTGSFLATGLPGLARYGPPAAADPFPVMRLAGVRGEVRVEQEGYPLIVRGQAGMGRVTLIAFDPTKDPFPYVRDRAQFWADVLQMEAVRREARNVGSLQPVSGPMIQALNDFPGIKPINFWFVGIFLAGYVVLIGPVDYFVLKRLRKLHWTWVSFPCIAVLFSAVAFLVMSSGRVSGLASNSVSIVDAAQGEKEAAGTTFMTFLSPRQTQYNVGVAAPAVGVVAPLEFNIMGGMGRGSSLTQTKCAVIARGERGERIDGLLVRVWDAQTVQASWRAPAGDLPEVKASPAPNGQYHVTVVNNTRDALKDATLIVPDGIIQLGTISSKGNVERTGLTPIPYQQYAASMGFGMETEFDDGAFRGRGRGFREEGVMQRETADRTARRVSLFGGSATGAPIGPFRRWAAGRAEHLSVAFDLPARLQLSCPGKNEAVLLYSVARPFAQIELEGQRPTAWDATVVRLRAPLGPASNPAPAVIP